MRALLLAGVSAVCLSTGAEASYLFTISEVGDDVVVQGNGSLNTSSLTLLSTGNAYFSRFIDPSDGTLVSAGAGLSSYSYYYSYGHFVSPFGTGSTASSLSSSGSLIGFLNGGSGTNYFLPGNYLSGDFIASSMTFSNTSLALLGLTSGSYVNTIGSGVNLDTVTIQVVAPSTDVPEPASLALLAAGLVGVGVIQRRRETNNAS